MLRGRVDAAGLKPAWRFKSLADPELDGAPTFHKREVRCVGRTPAVRRAIRRSENPICPYSTRQKGD